MINKRLILILLIFSISLLSLSAVSAIDVNETNDENQVISLPCEENDIVSLDSNDEIYGDMSCEHTHNDLKCEFKEIGNYYGETKLQLKLTNKTTDKGIGNKIVEIYVEDKLLNEYTTDSNGLIKTDFKKMPGTYFIQAKLKESGLTIGVLDGVKISGIPTNFGLSQTSAYYKEAKLKFTLTNILNKQGLAGEPINLKFSNGKKVTVTTNAKGVATYTIPFKPGTYSVTASTVSKYIKKNSVTLNKFIIGKTYLKVSTNSLTTSYNSGKTLNLKVTNYFTHHAMKNVKVSLKVYTGKKSKTVTVTTDKNGIAKYDASQLSVGSHKIEIKTAESYMDVVKKTTNVKITKAKLIINAPKITADENTTKAMKITVKNKETKKAMKNINVKVKVYTGKSYKTLNLKTNSKGQVSISSDSLTKATHNVAISVKGNSNVNAAAIKSTITII